MRDSWDWGRRLKGPDPVKPHPTRLALYYSLMVAFLTKTISAVSFKMPPNVFEVRRENRIRILSK